ncbi:hypothetical protein HPP92_017988 [Vanilla planifolia]|uniref:Uncharacterized protein n=1 Tax=Vanilla planifolia TaxID=51239 RepID=A0A835QD32_VANPL|nr:hypothetical protein HPP92_018562 [Vanilla planifolia]KAG0468660.1 hypothetical protein HPP92_017988 [Vanilla planifolia]
MTAPTPPSQRPTRPDSRIVTSADPASPRRSNARPAPDPRPDRDVTRADPTRLTKL